MNKAVVWTAIPDENWEDVAESPKTGVILGSANGNPDEYTIRFDVDLISPHWAFFSTADEVLTYVRHYGQPGHSFVIARLEIDAGKWMPALLNNTIGVGGGGTGNRLEAETREYFSYIVPRRKLQAAADAE